VRFALIHCNSVQFSNVLPYMNPHFSYFCYILASQILHFLGLFSLNFAKNLVLLTTEIVPSKFNQSLSVEGYNRHTDTSKSKFNRTFVLSSEFKSVSKIQDDSYLAKEVQIFFFLHAEHCILRLFSLSSLKFQSIFMLQIHFSNHSSKNLFVYTFQQVSLASIAARRDAD
jgi:hypothetical protein